MNGNEQLERELESFLQEDDSRLAVLYRKLPRPEPDAKIDGAVLAIARRAASPSSHSHNRRWLPAFSVAAAVLLAASVAVRVGPQIWNSHNPHPASERNEQIIGVQTQEPAKSAPPASAAPPAPPAMAPPPMPSLSTRKMAQPSIPAEKVVVPIAPTPAPPAQRFDLQKAKPAAPKTAAMPMPRPQSAPREFSAGRVEKDRAGDDKSQSHSTPQPASVVAFPAASAQRQPNESSKQSDESSAQKRELRQADSAIDDRASGAAASAANTAASAESTPPPVAPADSHASTSDRRAELIHNSHLYPESWITAIRRLMQAGHDIEARENLDYFRKKYPDYHLPADLEHFAQRAK